MLNATVASPELAEARMIFEARIAIECEITRMVAGTATREMLAPLRKNVDGENVFRRQGRIREAVRASGEFHILLGAASGNDILAGIVRQLEAHKVQAAVTLMRKHLLHVEESLNFDSHARGPLDLRRIYAPGGKV